MLPGGRGRAMGGARGRAELVVRRGWSVVHARGGRLVGVVGAVAARSMHARTPGRVVVGGGEGEATRTACAWVKKWEGGRRWRGGNAVRGSDAGSGREPKNSLEGEDAAAPRPAQTSVAAVSHSRLDWMREEVLRSGEFMVLQF